MRVCTRVYAEGGIWSLPCTLPKLAFQIWSSRSEETHPRDPQKYQLQAASLHEGWAPGSPMCLFLFCNVVLRWMEALPPRRWPH